MTSGKVDKSIALGELFRKDGGICQICHDPVSMDVRWPDPRSASIDHIIPLSKGGDHTWRNVQLAHLGCNCSKNDKIDDAALLGSVEAA